MSRLTKPLTDEQIRRSMDFTKPRCATCGRVVTWQFKQLGLGVIDTERVETNESIEFRWKAQHTYPCVGVSVRLKLLIRELVRIANAAHAGAS